ncbi:MAG: FAD-dependent thymidylate synthase [Calditrichaeota bacterium]|nr:FAD-dependent thymidylate synthase [Calditrichota bacterium]
MRAAIEGLGEELRNRIDFDSFTPETVSAAYARISRDPSHVTELRRSARFAVARARKSNENIIFGLGHASVAEHAVFNFDISHLSRLSTEELQYHRLQSFTEKSQRYITIGEEYVVPSEIAGSPSETEFRTVVGELFSAYSKILRDLHKHHQPDDTTDLSKTELRDIENRAKEDARYLLPLACMTQMGMTVNARNLEHLLWELSDHPLSELRDLGQALHKAVGRMAPSLVKYITRGAFPRENRARIAELLGSASDAPPSEIEFFTGPSIRVVHFDDTAEQRVAEAFAFSSGRRDNGGKVASDGKFWKAVFNGLSPHDSLYREFETARASFEIEMSATCYAQFKRHRLMTQIVQEYDLQYAAVVPPAIEELGQGEVFRTAVKSATDSAAKLSRVNSLAWPYLITNSHVKRVLIDLNARELNHLVRLRSDAHAQWEIQEVANQMLELLKDKWPNILALTCGKDRFDKTYSSYFR